MGKQYIAKEKAAEMITVRKAVFTPPAVAEIASLFVRMECTIIWYGRQ